MSIIELNEENYEEKLKETIIIDFHAQWCAPCNRMTPHFKSACEEFKGVVTFAKVDVDDFPNLAEAFHVKVMPTLVLVKRGKPVANIKGYCDKDTIVNFIKESLIIKTTFDK
jgi:thioredoxin 1